MQEIRDYFAIIASLIAIGAVLITAGGLVSAIKRVIADVAKLGVDMETNTKKLHEHIANQDAHVNHLYMKTLEDKISDVKQGNKEMNQKLDKIIERLIDNPALKRAEK